jgi:RNA polymerase sigma-70 factor (ECF subfamily)
MELDLEQLYKKYRDNIFAIGLNYFGNPSDADDIVQETFYKLSKSRTDFDSEEHIRNWLIRVAVNECKRISLSFWGRKRLPLEEYMETISFETKEESELFSEVMKLKPKYRQAIHLFYYEGYSTTEIADILHVSQSAVTTRLARARHQLKENLQEVWHDE